MLFYAAVQAEPRLSRLPCHVRRDMAILGVQKRIFAARRLGGEHVEIRARDSAFVQRPRERGLVDQSAARGIDEDCGRLA